MKEVLNKLLTVKSIVTISLTAIFCVLALKGVVSGEQFLVIFTVIIGFYFGTQSEKHKAKAEDKEVQVNE